MHQEEALRRQGEIVLGALRFTLMACAAGLAGALGMVAWNVVVG